MLEQFTLTPVKISSKNKMILFFLQNLSKNFKILSARCRTTLVVQLEHITLFKFI